MDQLERLMMVANGNELAQSSSQTMQVAGHLSWNSRMHAP